MKIINTFWEFENLGLSSEEIIIEIQDNIQDVKQYLENNQHKQYVVAKVPQPKIEYFNLLTANGFEFREVLLEVKLELKYFELPSKFRKIDSLVSYKKVSEINGILNEINLGIFDSDRIALDSKFGVNVSSKRYSNWLLNEFKNNSSVFEIIYKQKAIGFFGIKMLKEGAYDNFLAGIFKEYKSFGFGFSIISKAIEEMQILGGTTYVTHISSNNLSVIRMYESLGFTTQNIQYVFVKH